MRIVKRIQVQISEGLSGINTHFELNMAIGN